MTPRNRTWVKHETCFSLRAGRVTPRGRTLNTERVFSRGRLSPTRFPECREQIITDMNRATATGPGERKRFRFLEHQTDALEQSMFGQAGVALKHLDRH